MKFFALVRAFLRHQRGVALIEMVAVAPFLILLVLGSVELSRYVMIAQKVNRAGFVLTDIASQETPATKEWVLNDCEYTLHENGLNEPIAGSDLNQLSRLMSPFNNTAKQMAILSSVKKESGALVIKWQTSGGGSLGTDVRSDVTANGPRGTCCQGDSPSFSGDTATQIAGMLEGENVIVGEVFYRYEPILAPVLSRVGFTIRPTTMVRRIYMRPRNGDLDYLPPTYPVPTPPQPELPESCKPAECCTASHYVCSYNGCSQDCAAIDLACNINMDNVCGGFVAAACIMTCDTYDVCP